MVLFLLFKISNFDIFVKLQQNFVEKYCRKGGILRHGLI